MGRHRTYLWATVVLVGLPLCVCGIPASLVMAQYMWPADIYENDTMGYFLLATPENGPDSGRAVYGFRATDVLQGCATPDLAFSVQNHGTGSLDLAKLRLARPEEVAARLGRRFHARSEQLNDSGMGEFDIRVSVDGDTISVVSDYDRDKYVFSDRCAYQVEKGRARFLYTRRYDSSWPPYRH